MASKNGRLSKTGRGLDEWQAFLGAISRALRKRAREMAPRNGELSASGGAGLERMPCSFEEEGNQAVP